MGLCFFSNLELILELGACFGGLLGSVLEPLKPSTRPRPGLLYFD